MQGGADHLAVTADDAAFRNVGQRDLMALGHVVAQLQAIGQDGAGRQAEIVDHDRDIVVRVQTDHTRGVRDFCRLDVHRFVLAPMVALAAGISRAQAF